MTEAQREWIRGATLRSMYASVDRANRALAVGDLDAFEREVRRQLRLRIRFELASESPSSTLEPLAGTQATEEVGRC